MGKLWWWSGPKMGGQELWQLQEEWKRGVPSEPSQDPLVPSDPGGRQRGREGGKLTETWEVSGDKTTRSKKARKKTPNGKHTHGLEEAARLDSWPLYPNQIQGR